MSKMGLSNARIHLDELRTCAKEGGLGWGQDSVNALIDSIDAVIGTQEEPTFILTTRDRFAAGAVRSWIYAVRVLGDEAKDKVAQAKDVLDRMMDFREKNPDDIKNPK